MAEKAQLTGPDFAAGVDAESLRPGKPFSATQTASLFCSSVSMAISSQSARSARTTAVRSPRA